MADEAVRTSQETQMILEKIDGVSATINEVKNKVTRLETIITMQPQIDAQMHEVIATRVAGCEVNIKELQNDRIWANRLIIATALTAIVGIIMTLIKVS
jgi:hypothetical protein